MGGISCDRRSTVLLFGPLNGSLNTTLLRGLQQSLHDEVTRNQHWATATLAELPNFWEKCTSRTTKSHTLPGKRLLNNLHRWLTEGPEAGEEAAIENLPHTLLIPLAVLTQLLQFEYYLKARHGDIDSGLKALREQKVQTLGFCTGLLSAYAVASSSKKDDLEKYGSVSIRLAMLVGTIVDALEVESGRATSFATAWHTPQQGADLTHILERFSGDAYKSVLYDEHKATVTVSAQNAGDLIERLRLKGITAAEVGLHGRFHTAAHQDALNTLLILLREEPALQLPDARQLLLSSYSNAACELLQQGPLHERAAQALLVEQADWHSVFAAMCHQAGAKVDVVTFSSERCVPPSLRDRIGSQLVADRPNIDFARKSSTDLSSTPQINKNDIAIVGLSIKVAGADDVDEFSTLLRSGVSQHIDASLRIPFGTNSTPWRPDVSGEDQKWFGNFIRDVDSFDHRFFRRSARESASMDPQQRLFLQAAYQAVETAGWFARTEDGENQKRDANVGVYVGACATDYENNIACHPSTAFSATGCLRSFIAGKVSHYFGWTGPSMTFDTACSASAVAIHTACKAILSGECSAALVGGVNTIHNPLWFQNLAGATFLSPTGQCKPFDELADGYCRGEGIACVLLKPMKAALADGDRVLGCISSTAVYQNDNSTPVFVPNAPSLTRLFTDVIRDAGLRPGDISLVEAHGTGTQVGDSAEYQSIRQVMGGSLRSKPLPIGSVKGFVGHTESASGVISLIKVLTQMNEAFIPSQASHSKLNQHFNASTADMMEVPTSLKPWTQAHKAALINNYGASGSNASLIVRQAPYQGHATAPIHRCTRQPFWIKGLDGRSIEAYCGRLAQFLMRQTNRVSLADIAFNMARQSNHSFTRGLRLSCDSVSDLVEQLSSKAHTHSAIQPARSVVLCFGGQVSTFVGLDVRLYESVRILRKHLDECDAVIQNLELDSIFPDIFSREPFADTVKLQTMLFALQYACAKSWMDCGVKVKAVVGHSFGEITALCVSGVLSLTDTIKLVARRAKIVRDAWGTDPGSMIAVEADLSLVQRLLSYANNRYQGTYIATIACYNGPRSFTLAGSSEVMNAVAEALSAVAEFKSIRSKKLNVTNAFHSTLVEPLRPALEQVTRDLTFNDAIIPLERATDVSSRSSKVSASFVFDHMRNPVFFSHAVQRLARDNPSCIWLEAGSASTIAIMANRALGSAPDMHFQGLNITAGSSGMENLCDTTVALWEEGLHVAYWPHHGTQTQDYQPLLLPAYQFEKAKHWLEYKPVADAILSRDHVQAPQVAEPPLGLWTFVAYQDVEHRRARFKINTESQKFKSLVSGHIAVQTAPICPSTVQMDMAIEALRSLLPTSELDLNLQPVIRDVKNHVALCIDPARTAWLDLQAVGSSWRDCEWNITTTVTDSKGAGQMLLVEGHLELRLAEDVAYQREFARFERLTSHQTCVDLLYDNAGEADDILQGRNVYRAFAEVVDYGEYYQGVKRVVGKANECAGQVILPHSSDTWLDVPMVDSCSQVAGLWVNCMTERSAADVFLATGCEMIMRSPHTATVGVEGKVKQDRKYHVFARHHCDSDKAYLTDCFVFDAESGQLVEVIIGIQYSRLAKASLSRTLTRLTGDSTVLRCKPEAAAVKAQASTVSDMTPVDSRPKQATSQPIVPSVDSKKASHPDIRSQLRDLVANICGVDADEVQDHSEMADLGLDSLVGMELKREVHVRFGVKLDPIELLEATSFGGFVACTTKAVYGADYRPAEEADEDSDVSLCNGSSSSWDEVSTPAGLLMEEQRGGAEVIASDTVNIDKVNDLQLASLHILAAFEKIKWSTDQRLRESKLDDTDAMTIARSNRLCVALIVEAFEQLGCSLRSAATGQVLSRIPHQPQHDRLVDWLYNFLSKDARLVAINAGEITRTNISAPRKSSETLYNDILQAPDAWQPGHKLAYFAGKHLADVLRGTTHGIGLLFGSTEGRGLVEGLYCDLPYNRLAYEQMRDVIGELCSNLPQGEGPLRILEMGAGTGGTTRILAPFLAELGVPVVYTFTDLSPSMVVQARRRFKAYPFMQFAVHDIEKAPAAELRGQHIVLASNAVHATHNLKVSATNIRMALRDDGFLMLTEMTEGLSFVDLVFGLLEGWWRFDDGRHHALVSESQWEEELQAAGFGQVDWTDGELPENKIQRVILAMASGPTWEKPTGSKTPLPKLEDELQNRATREAEAEMYVAKYSASFAPKAPFSTPTNVEMPHVRSGVVITGGTGSLGSHLVAAFSARPDVGQVICLNRRSSETSLERRQQDALHSRGITISSAAQAKIRVIGIDPARKDLGLSKEETTFLTYNATHIIHNAWSMSITRPLHGFEQQFAMLRSLLEVAANVHTHRGIRVTFQLVSSIGVVGQHPVDASNPEVSENRVPFASVPNIGYCEAKWVCERILDETMHRHPDKFRPMVVRPGQIAGSRTSGYWNPMEHLASLVKSSQALQTFPALRGRLQWVPVNDVADIVADLALYDGESYPVYHIDNPVGQSWEDMVSLLAGELQIPEQSDSIIAFKDWIRRVRRSPLSKETDNPALKVIGFLENHFERMSSGGGLILRTSKARRHSATMAAIGPVPSEVVKLYIRAWKDTGFLS